MNDSTYLRNCEIKRYAFINYKLYFNKDFLIKKKEF